MKIVFRLVGRRPGKSEAQHFTLESEEGKGLDDQRRAWEHFKLISTVHGLQFGLAGSGVITLKADNDQLNTDTVAAIRRNVEAALGVIK
jgi:hypothetical protein